MRVWTKIRAGLLAFTEGIYVIVKYCVCNDFFLNVSELLMLNKLTNVYVKRRKKRVLIGCGKVSRSCKLYGTIVDK